MGVRLVPARRSPFWRYTAFQIPGWVLAATAGWWLYRSMDVPAWAAAGLPAFWFVKDMALYPLLRTAYDATDTPPVERLIGSRGRPVEPLAPCGYVRIGGELWLAETDDGEPIDRHADVEVVGAKGLVLRVRRVVEGTLNPEH